MNRVKLYVHKYLGCLCALTQYNKGIQSCYDDGQPSWEEPWRVKLTILKERLVDAPECWELIDQWEEK